MSIYRNVVWYCRGLKQYTKKGYEDAAKNFREGDLDTDVTGRSFMVTGANSGIGKVVALESARRGGIVHLICRSKERGEQAQQEITQATNSADRVHLHILDISKPKDVRKFVDNFVASGEPLHVLVNNAGCMINERKVDEETKLEMNFQTNTLGTYLLTEGLLPVLSKAEDPRVIIVSSGGMLVEKLDPTDLQFERRSFDGVFAYAQNKRQQVVLTEEWAKGHPNVFFAAMHPGWADTPAVASSMPDFHQKMKGKLRTPEQGADSAVWLAVAKNLSIPSGSFVQDRAAVSTHLPLAWTKSSRADIDAFLTKIRDIAEAAGRD